MLFTQSDGVVDTLSEGIWGIMMHYPNNTTAVLCIGNLLMGDDAFGSFVIQELKKYPSLKADLIDAGTDPATVLDAFFKYGHIILIDAVDFKAEPGTLCRVGFNDLRKLQQDFAMSIHNLNPASMLKLIEQMQQRSGNTKEAIPDGYLLGIQPKNISPGLGLSPAVEKALPRAVDFIIKSLSKIDQAAVVSSFDHTLKRNTTTSPSFIT